MANNSSKAGSADILYLAVTPVAPSNGIGQVGTRGQLMRCNFAHLLKNNVNQLPVSSKMPWRNNRIKTF
jgi:hypothetical protein